MIKDIQRHAIRPELQHIDLLTVKRGERVEIEVLYTLKASPLLAPLLTRKKPFFWLKLTH